MVLDNGSDGATSHLGLFGGWAALERGYHAMTFDGPGQQAACSGFDWLDPYLDPRGSRS